MVLECMRSAGRRGYKGTKWYWKKKYNKIKLKKKDEGTEGHRSKEVCPRLHDQEGTGPGPLVPQQEPFPLPHTAWGDRAYTGT